MRLPLDNYPVTQATPAALAFMVEHTTGIICAAMRGADLDHLQLPLMVPSRENEEALATAFTITVDAREGTTTGVSASDRCATIQTLADPGSSAHSLRRPGHIFPLRYHISGPSTDKSVEFVLSTAALVSLHAYCMLEQWLIA